MKIRFACLVLTLILTVISFAQYSGGTGDPNNPYLISTAEDLNDIGNHEEDWDKHFLMVADINLADYTGTEFNIIGTSFIYPFTGTFDGNDHKIFNFTYSSEEVDVDYIGLFGVFKGENAKIKNLGLINPDIAVGTSGSEVGSLVGYLMFGTITNCYTSGGSVIGYFDVGGLVGYNFGTISNSYSTSSVLGDSAVGGLMGYNYGDVINCYSTGSINGQDYVGGLIGLNNDTVTNCYSTGSVDGDNWFGGLVGFNNYIVTESFWDVNSSGQSTGDGGAGKTTTEMQTKSTFADAGWDFIDIWNIGENQTYPFLRTRPAGDINHDGIVDFYDLAILANRWLQDTP